MKLRRKALQRKLTTEQQDMVLRALPLVCKVAHKDWQRSCLPARYWPDIRSEAFLASCRSALNYIPGEMSFERVVAFQASKHVWKWITKVRQRQEGLLGDEDQNEPLIEEDESALDLLLSLLPFLTDKQRKVVELRYGLSGEIPLSCREAAPRVGVNKSAVFALEKKAITNLQKMARGGLRNGFTVEEIKEKLGRSGKNRKQLQLA